MPLITYDIRSDRTYNILITPSSLISSHFVSSHLVASCLVYLLAGAAHYGNLPSEASVVLLLQAVGAVERTISENARALAVRSIEV